MHTIKDKFVEMCYLISNDNDEYSFWWEYIDESNNEENLILKSKMTNLIKLLNENKEDVLYKDIETEIWEMI